MLKKQEISSLTEKVAEYLKNHHGIDNPISMKILAEIFDVSERDIREIIELIIIRKILIIGNTNGYWVAKNEEEIRQANLLNKTRIKKSLIKLAANGGEIDWMFNFLGDLQKKNKQESSVTLFDFGNEL